MKTKTYPKARRPTAFSLIELMVSVAVLSILLVIVFQMLDQMQKVWKRTRQTVTEFKDSRTGFDELGRRLGQATMNAYYGYKFKTGSLGPSKISTKYGTEIIRQSELHFVSGPAQPVLFNGSTTKAEGGRPGHAVFFQAPFGFCRDRNQSNQGRLQYEQLNSLLNAWGYFVEFNTDELDRPLFLNKLRNAPKPRPRYRLMEFRQPTEYLQIYKLNLQNATSLTPKDSYAWFTQGLFSVNSEWNSQVQDVGSSQTFFRTVRPIAENIIAMIILPRGSESGTSSATAATALAPAYLYDTRSWQTRSATNALNLRTRHVLPPILDISFITVEENSFATFALRTGIEQAKDDPKLVTSELFQDATKSVKDFDTIEKKLRSLRLEYRIFNSTIRLRESKWTDT